MTEYELIDMIRMRTAMYTGDASPTHLRSFLSGYYFAKKDQEIKDEEPKFHNFQDWVANKFNYNESTSGWAYMIEDQREDKKEALYLFYELLDEYRGIKHQELANIKFNHEDKTDRTWRGYSRLKKVKGTFKAIPKPLPKELIIRKIKLEKSWFQMVGKNDKGEILFLWSSTEMEKVYKMGKEIFGIEKDEWTIKEENGS
jgi:hypothetical protein